MLTSAVQRVPVLLFKAAELAQQGAWTGQRYRFGLQEGALDLAPFNGLLSPAEEQRVQAARAAILAGQLVVEP